MSYVYNVDRDQLVEPEAEKLFARLRADEPAEVGKEDSQDSGANSGNSAPRDSDSLPEGPGGDYSAQSCDYVPYIFGGVPTAGERAAASGIPPSPTPTFTGNTAAEDICG